MANVNIPKPSSRSFVTATLSTAADGLSDELSLSGLTLSSLQMSTAWTSADIGFQASVDGSTNYQQVYGSTGNLLTFQTSANRTLAFNPAQFAGIERLRLISLTTAGTTVAVAQAAARTVKLGVAEFVNAD